MIRTNGHLSEPDRKWVEWFQGGMILFSKTSDNVMAGLLLCMVGLWVFSLLRMM